MGSRILLRDRPVQVKGHVIVDYVRGDKILERIEGDNVCFEAPFNHTADWAYYIKTYPQLMLYNSDKAPDLNLPYQRRANVIGWGSKGAVASGTTQGAWNAQKSYDAKIINNGDGISWKWAYDFGVTQMVGLPIKSLGIGQGNLRQTLNRYALSSFNQTAFTAKGYMGYKLNMSGVNRLIQVMNLKQQLTFNDINIASAVGTDTVSGDSWYIGFAADNDKAYILRYNGASGQSARKTLYEFEDDTFTTLLRTYNVTKTSYAVGTVRGFVVYNNKIYFPNSNIVEYDFVADTDPVTITQPVSPISIPNYNSGGADPSYSRADHGLCFDGKYLFRIREEWWIPVFNMETRQYEPECAVAWSTNAHNHAYYIEPLIPGQPVVCTSGNKAYPYNIMTMLTCYTLPADAPERPEDSGVSVDYQIDINYI